ncbi:MAG TPA: SDR family NAD(P)-dependent oxidoreductase [Candidatus Dormibacteraeota bacterium]|nr:SDR family NAD(P)-dependent oxidoreductase [Candidatus Dormibacteraeota bacterium]
MIPDEGIRRWLVDAVAARAGIRPEDVDEHEPFSAYGIDSAAAAALAGELEARTGLPLGATLLFEHPTVADVVAHLAAPRTAERAPVRPATSPAGRQPIAVVGIGCRLPGARGPEGLWRLLVEGRDAVGEVPPGRWSDELAADDPVRLGGFLDDVAGFDARFFRIPADEATRMDPQQRMLLETSWEALEDAGWLGADLRRSSTGVFVGISGNEYAWRQVGDAGDAHALTATGNALSIAANRLSYLLDLRGPSLAVDTACSSSLVALHLAIGSLRRGECDRALVCGVNLLLEPGTSAGLRQAGMLAPDGRCKAFSAAADGYVRGEGCVCVLLAPLERARRAGDRVYALVLGSAVNQDGRTNGLTAPSMAAQREVLELAYADAGRAPQDVGYVECHGTGTLLGDRIEAMALGSVVGRREPGRGPCLIGSVKSNLGHLEAAAGLTALIKVALALRHGTIPASLHCVEPSPQIQFDELRLDVVRETRPWPGADGIAGVSSFGFGGTNAHAVLAAPPPQPSPAREGGAAERPRLLPVSARSAPALRASLLALAERLEVADAQALPDVVHTAALRRDHHPLRLAIVGERADELASRLRDAAERPLERLVPTGRPPRIGFVFPGQGSQWAGMGRGLLRQEPLFRSFMERCDEVHRRAAGWSLLELLAGGGDPTRLDDTECVQPLLVALQVALAGLLRSAGVRPAAVVGHSVGEISAAHVAGLLNLDEALDLAFRRGRSMAPTAGRGRMLAVDVGEAEARQLAEPLGERVAVGAVNGPTAVVLSGDAGALESLRAELAAEGHFTRWLPVGYAFHSPQMRAAALSFEAGVADARRSPGPQAAAMYSTVTGGRIEGVPSPGHWRANVEATVRFGPAVDAMLAAGDADVLVEIGPHPVLRGPLRQVLQAAGRPEVSLLSAMERDVDDGRSFLALLADLYALGQPVDWRSREGRGGRLVSLPGYPWQHERHWLEARTVRGRLQGPGLGGRRLDLAGAAAIAVWQAEVGIELQPFLADHLIHGSPVLPASAQLETVLAAAREHRPGSAVGLRDVAFPAPLPLGAEPATVQVTFRHDEDGLGFTLHARADGSWLLVALGRVAEDEASGAGGPRDEAARARCTEPVPSPLLYDLLRRRGLGYGPAFRTLAEVWRGDGEAVGLVRSAGGQEFTCDPTLLDGAFQLVSVAGAGQPELEGLLVPAGIDSLRWLHAPAGEVWAEARIRSVEATAGLVVADVRLRDGRGDAAEVRGLRLRRAGKPSSPAGHPHVWLYERRWLEHPSAGEACARDGRWLVLGDADGVADELARAGRGVDHVVARPGTDYAWTGSGQVTLRPERRDDWDRLLREATDAGARPLDSVVCLWALDRGGAWPADTPGRALALARSTAELVKALSAAAGPRLPDLWLVTRRVHAVTGGEADDPAAAVLWGLGRVLPFEHPALQCRCLDVDGEDGTVDLLLAELLAPSDEAEVAHRAGRRFVRRLAPAAAAPSAPAISVTGDATYVITGGLGALGLVIAEHLVAGGARHVALVGRHADRAQEPAAAAVLERLRSAGATVRIVEADVRRRERVASLLETLRADGPAIRGVVHAAGRLDDGPLLTMTPDAFAEAMGPKVDGAWHLHELTAGDPLDWFVLFSSAASVLGSPGQANYCAANAFLDALDEHRRGIGRPACVVNWGPWADAGMAARTGGVGAPRAASAVDGLHPADALRTLDHALAAPGPLLALPFDLRDLLRFYPTKLGLPLFEQLLTSSADIGATTGQVARRPAVEAPYLAPRTDLERRIAAIWQRAFGIEEIGVNDPFFELGGDSVFANQIVAEVSRATGVKVDAERAFANLTVAGLAELVEEATRAS